MIVDSSALIAIVRREEDWEDLVAAIGGQSGLVSMSAVTWIESRMVAMRDNLREELEQFVQSINIEIVPVDLAQADIAMAGFERYGKGRHPAQLNLGDLFSYALAISRDDALLFKGGDFSRTDVKSARP